MEISSVVGKKSTMRSVASLSRSAAAALVEREERRTGSRMAAYEVVAATVGISSDWIRKFVNGTEGKEPKLTVGFNLMAHYRAICERVESAGAMEEQLKDEVNAALESFDLLVEATKRTDRSAAEAERVDAAERA